MIVTNKRIEEQSNKLARRNKYLKQQLKLTKMAESSQAFGQKALAGSLSIGLSAKSVFGTGIDFEKSMSKVQALTRLDKNI